eukprot:895278-Amphidinium_carterae.1
MVQHAIHEVVEGNNREWQLLGSAPKTKHHARATESCLCVQRTHRVIRYGGYAWVPGATAYGEMRENVALAAGLNMAGPLTMPMLDLARPFESDTRKR